MAASNGGDMPGSSKPTITGGKQLSGASAELVVAGFQRLRQEQRSLATKAAELEIEVNEHSLVIDALEEADPGRKCYRLIGGVLVERSVQDILPSLLCNREQLTKIVESLNTQMQAKGKELNNYRERYSIRIAGEEGATTHKTTASGDRAECVIGRRREQRQWKAYHG
ncbi:prefoldin subunit 2-like [Engraulis encrasicolus]|uniref:prefoldin subunit 2-like n=1 Tax=Engraulis encrasicolus TaxID=184585 RepID=UPI002FD3D736